MRRLVGGLVTVVIGVVALGAQTPRDRGRPAEPAGTASISGRMTVARPEGPAPVRRAAVTLESTALAAAKVVDTDTEGRFRFDNLPAGSYRIHGEKAGFVPMVDDERRALAPPDPFEVAAGARVTRDLPMRPGAALEGRVWRATGEPAINVVVSAVRMAYTARGRAPVALRSARTDDRGQFRIHTLPPGEYYVDAAPDPLDAAGRIQTPGPRLPIPARAYFPGSPRLGDARLVAVAVGQTASSIDFGMSAITVAAVRGTMLNAAGQPAKDGGIRIQRVGGPVGEVRGLSTPAGNQFEFSAVPPGDYWLMATWRPAKDAPPEFGLSRLTVGGEDQPVTIATAPAAGLTGRVTGVPLSGALEVVAYETEYEWPAPPGEARWTWTAPVAADGAFRFSALPGPRMLRVNGLPRGTAVKRIVVGEADVTHRTVESTLAAPVTVTIELTSSLASVTGVVRDASGAAVPHARVVVFGDEPTWGPWSLTIHTAEAGSDGRYTVDGVVPGRYRVVAVDTLEDMAWFDADTLRRLAAGVNDLPLAAGAATINLVVKR